MTERTRLTYTGDVPLYLGGAGAPRPGRVEHGTVVEVDAEAAESYAEIEGFALTPEAELPGPEVPEPVPVSRVDDIAGDAPGELRGAALRDALLAADLPVGGTVAERQQRLATWQAEHEPGAPGNPEV